MSAIEDNHAPIELALDFEEEIETHTIRKSSSETCIKKYEQCIPLLIEDIPKIQIGSSQNKSKTVFGVRFQSIMIYGHSIPLKLKHDSNERLYRVDDGTGSIIVHHRYTSEQLHTSRRISELGAQVTHIKKYGFLQLGENYKDPKGADCKTIVACMDTVLNKIKQQSYLPNEFFSRGSKVSVIGNPYRSRDGEFHIWAKEMNHDIDGNCNKELFFKRHLIQTYENIYLKNSN